MKPLAHSAIGLSLLSVLCAAISPSASAVDVAWVPATAGTYSWSSTSNWGTGTGPVPTSGDRAVIAVTSAQTINLGADTSVGGVSLTGGAGNSTVTISDAGNGYTLTSGSLTVATKCFLTVNANLTASSGSTLSMTTAGTGSITLGAGYTVSAPLAINGAATVNLNSNLNTGSAATAVTVNQGVLNWNVGTFTSTSTAANVLNISSMAPNKSTTVNFQKSFSSSGGITLATTSANGCIIALYGTANGVTIGSNITASSTVNTGINTNTITLGANNTAATSANPTSVTFSGNYTTTDNYKRTHMFFAAANNTATFSGVIASSGTGTIFQKTGAGTVVFSGASANTYDAAASMEVAAGTLLLQKSSGVALTSGTVTVDSGATLKLGAASQITGTSALYVAGGAFDLQSFDQSLGSVQLTNGGTITGSGGTLTAANTFALQSGTASANLAGAAALNKTTVGTVTLSGSNTYSGATNVSTGRLDVDGSLSSSSSVSVSSGATLGGQGKVNGSVSVDGGTLNGNGLTVGGHVSFTGASTVSGVSTSAGGYTVTSGTTNVTGTAVGAITVSAGVLQGTGRVGNVSVSGTLAGTLSAGALSGSGLVSPGNSPGILTAASVDSSTLSFAFELGARTPDYTGVANSNDILHITGSLATLTSNNLISIYFSNLATTTIFDGALFADTLSTAQLKNAVSLATFKYYALDGDGTLDHTGDTLFNGKYYTALDSSSVTYQAVTAPLADFATGTVTNGSMLEFTVVPEPDTWAMLAGGLGALFGFQRIRNRRIGA